MARQRTQYRRRTYDLPDDFPERLKRFQEESRTRLRRPDKIGVCSYNPSQPAGESGSHMGDSHPCSLQPRLTVQFAVTHRGDDGTPMHRRAGLAVGHL